MRIKPAPESLVAERASVPSHVLLRLRFDDLADVLPRQVVFHAELAARVERLLGQRVIATEGACRINGWREYAMAQ
jgi:hypothetical protein